jgi:hypothetical protein
MEAIKIKRLISMMYLDIITGDVHVHNQYMNTMITQIVVNIRREKLEPRQPAVEKFRTRLHNTVSMILHNNHPLPAADVTREIEIKKLLDYFDRFVIKIDGAIVADERGLDQIGLLEDIETLEYARNICYSASTDYSNFMAGVPQGLTDASNKYAFVINLITPIIYKYDMVDISEQDFTNAARLAAKRLESAREVKANV